MFKEWLYLRDQQLAENLWGNIPSRLRKPSDGWGTKPQTAEAPKMMRKMKKK